LFYVYNENMFRRLFSGFAGMIGTKQNVLRILRSMALTLGSRRLFLETRIILNSLIIDLTMERSAIKP
jgi:hypothetical protein